MELIIILIFTAMLIGCIAFDISIIIALAAGYFLFFFYALKKDFDFKEILAMSFEGIKTVKNVLIAFLLIGMMTATWRASGCILAVVCYVSRLITPSVFIMLSFLLCMIVSVLTGTSFGTSATMGVICMSIAVSMNISVFWVGGAILAGSFWGDRCSPVSTSALLVSTITETDLYKNIKNMVRTAVVPTIIVCVIYLVAGIVLKGSGEVPDVRGTFGVEFIIRPVCVLPAVIIIVLALFRLDVKKVMLISTFVAAFITVLVQGMTFSDLVKTLVTGYSARAEELAPIINGGGIISMVRVAVIVCIASCYSGIFKKTGLLDFLQEKMVKLAEKTGVFRTVLLISIPAAMIACNQTLAIMLTNQLASKLSTDKEKLALYLENSVVLIAALIPWSIAGNVPLAAVGAPTKCMLTACFLYVLPLWCCITERKTNA